MTQTLEQLSAAATIDLAELPEQIESLRNHADERRRRGWRMSADNLEASANIIEALAAECALYRTGQLVAVADDAIERVARALCDEAEYAWDKLPDMPDSVCGHSAPECCKYYWRRLAKAAIAAMKDTQP